MVKRRKNIFIQRTLTSNLCLKIIVLLFTILIPTYSNAQQFGNEWINFNQSYYKIPVAQAGIYRITFNDLLGSGVPVNSIDPRRLQIFHRGREQAIFVQGQEDARFDNTDFIEFYGSPNDGKSDRVLYEPQDAQPHQFHNLYSDTTSYFLTWKLNNESGRRMETYSEVNVSNIPVETYHWEERLLLQTQEYSGGRVYPEGNLRAESWYTSFDYGEGWTGNRISKGNGVNFPLTNLTNIANSGPQPQMEILLAGRNHRPHRVNILVGPNENSLRNIGTVQFDFFYIQKFTSPINFSDIGNDGRLVVRIFVEGFPDVPADQVSVSFIRLRYPQRLNMENRNAKAFELRSNNSGKSYIELTNFTSINGIFDITDADNVKKIGFEQSGGIVSAIVPSTFIERKLWVRSPAFLTPRLKMVNMRQINPASHNYLIISHKRLMKPAGGQPDAVKAYGGYRASLAGGKYDTLVMDVQQLYDQFNYGEISPAAVRRFANYMIRFGNPQHLFLIGKSLTVNHNYYRQNPLTANHHDLVPTAGWPGSDIFFTVGLSGSDGIGPAIPTGRLNVSNPNDVINYLNKVKETEQFAFNDLWKKNIIHLSGGQNARELVNFRSYVNGFRSFAETFFYGAKTTTVGKKTNNSVELINISEEINNGAALVTFFGHSGATLVDIEIGFASHDALGYNNRGKYPVMLVNGCNAGNIFTSTYTFGEDWVRTPNRGAIAFLAHAGVGFESELRRNTEFFYRAAFADSVRIKKSLGEILKIGATEYMAGLSPNHARLTQVQQMVLQGDPAVKIFGAKNPDYAIRPEDLSIRSFDDNPVTALSDSFKIDIIIKNYGIAIPDPVWIQVKRHFSDGRVVSYDPVNYAPVKYQDTLSYTVSNLIDGSVFGNNRFEVIVNPGNTFRESNYQNNKTFFEYFIPVGGTFNLSPLNFSIVNNRNLKLLSQSTNLFDDEREFLFEIDTDPQFNSSAKKLRTVSGKVLVQWELDLFQGSQPKDSTVFYWRTRYAQPKSGENTDWMKSSFIYINNSPSGWSQASFSQLGKTEFTGLNRDPFKEEWSFKDINNLFKITTHGKNHPDHGKIELIINGVSYIYNSGFEGDNRSCTDNSINAVAFDRGTLSPFMVMPFSGFTILQRTSCGREPQVINNFLKNEIEERLLLNQYVNLMKQGDYVLMFSLGTVTYESWPATVKEKLREIGASDEILNKLKNNDPFILFGKKGMAPGEAIMITADYSSSTASNSQRIILEDEVKGKVSRATILSPRIGPASSWSRLINRTSGRDDQDEIIFYDVIGIEPTGKEVVLYEKIEETSLDISSINASHYPYLRLKLTLEDSKNFTPAQLKRWQVIYTGVPEGIISYKSTGGVDTPFKKMEGETFVLNFGFNNISNLTFTDSLLVEFTLFNENSRESKKNSFKIKALEAGNSVDFSIPIQTIGKTGDNKFKVNVNPQIQPEVYFHNNILDFQQFMKVEKDIRHPVLDVAFDGRYIMDGEIVSPSPIITIKVKDDNRILLKKDTVGVDVFIKSSCEECVFQKINLNSPQVRWTPATEDTPFTVEYRPEALEDGVYVLQVQAVDASGNKSGQEPYAVRFEVVNESAITHFYPYPNPFSSSTRFVFTLTGSEIPDELKIQIMTVTGKIVREITQDEIGPIRAGNNISQYAWDGKDEFGDQLANGVYLYRVIVKSGGKVLDRRETSADKAFKKNFGKLYILR
jgi:hypothetical protein